MKIYEALYNGMIEESSYATLSIHKTIRGAEMAIEFHKAERFKEHEKDEERRKKEYGDDYEPHKFAQWERWDINETELLD